MVQNVIKEFKQIYTDDGTIGGGGGQGFVAIRSSYTYVSEIKVFKQTWRIRGVTITYSDGTSFRAGQEQGDESTLSLQDGEKFTEVKLYPNAQHNRLGGIFIRTTRSEFNVLADNVPTSEAHVVPVGSGKCAGIFGSFGGDVDNFGIAMHIR